MFLKAVGVKLWTEILCPIITLIDNKLYFHRKLSISPECLSYPAVLWCVACWSMAQRWFDRGAPAACSHGCSACPSDNKSRFHSYYEPHSSAGKHTNHLITRELDLNTRTMTNTNIIDLKLHPTDSSLTPSHFLHSYEDVSME